jgi:hypothetical protein
MACLAEGGGLACLHTVNVLWEAGPLALAAVPALAIGALRRRVKCDNL